MCVASHTDINVIDAMLVRALDIRTTAYGTTSTGTIQSVYHDVWCRRVCSKEAGGHEGGRHVPCDHVVVAVGVLFAHEVLRAERHSSL